MKIKFCFFLFFLMGTAIPALCQNTDGEVAEINYLESSGVRCVAKINELKNGVITWNYKKEGEKTWKSADKLKYLGTNSFTYFTEIDAKWLSRASTSHYEFSIKSQKENDKTISPDFQIVDWTGKNWNVMIYASRNETTRTFRFYLSLSQAKEKS